MCRMTQSVKIDTIIYIQVCIYLQVYSHTYKEKKTYLLFSRENVGLLLIFALYFYTVSLFRLVLTPPLICSLIPFPTSPSSTLLFFHIQILHTSASMLSHGVLTYKKVFACPSSTIKIPLFKAELQDAFQGLLTLNFLTDLSFCINSIPFYWYCSYGTKFFPL